MLTTDNLLYLTQMISNFCGVYSINCLPKLQALSCNNAVLNQQNQQQHHQLTKLVIMNLDTDNLPGSHWVAMFINNGIAEIFDSFGVPPPPLLQAWAAQNLLKWIYEPLIMIQHPDTVTCGYYALVFCLVRPECKTLLDAIHYINTL